VQNTLLNEYNEKINFDKTAEPKGEIRGKSGKLIYVIQRHNASHLHYDLRLEIDGVLKSWAIPKEPPVEERIKRLAVQTEDHPIEYANFEGKIPDDQYGAGEVKIWDKGTYSPVEISEDKIIFNINGEKLKGTYCLIRLKKGKNWIFFRRKKLK
jgi:DNA ligase D-like protein (predicted 3'-phosphoesterase)